MYVEKNHKIWRYEFWKIPILINVPSKIRVFQWEKISKINKHTGTFISYYRVFIKQGCQNLFYFDNTKEDF